MALRKILKINYYGFLGFLGFLGFQDPWYFLFFLFFLFFFTPSQKQHAHILENMSMLGLMEKQAKEKSEHLQKIKDFMNNKDKIANDDVQKLLEVSDATAERYLNELEGQGILRQRGEKKGVFYEKIGKN